LHFFADEIWSINNIENPEAETETITAAKKHEENLVKLHEHEDLSYYYQLMNMISGVHFDFRFCQEKNEFVMEKIWQEDTVTLPDL
jgi:gamma-glutamylcysteine synthetase